MSSQPPVGNRRFEDDVVRLASLTINTNQLDGLDFINCKILGPAVLLLLENVTIQHCTFEAEPADLFWPLPEPRTVFGALGVRSCSFSNCRFESIGFAGPPELLEAMSRAIGRR